MSDTSEVLLKKKVVEQIVGLIEGLTQVSNKKDFLSLICELYANGNYDDKISPKPEEMQRTYITKTSSNKAREHMAQYGYTKLSDVIEDIVMYELNNPHGSLDDKLYQLLKERKG